MADKLLVADKPQVAAKLLVAIRVDLSQEQERRAAVKVRATLDMVLEDAIRSPRNRCK